MIVVLQPQRYWYAIFNGRGLIRNSWDRAQYNYPNGVGPSRKTNWGWSDLQCRGYSSRIYYNFFHGYTYSYWGVW